MLEKNDKAAENSTFQFASRLKYFVAALLIAFLHCVPQFSGPSAFGQPELSDPGYIESPFITSRFRLRYDAGFDLNRPDRAEFFYATWAGISDHEHAIKDTNQIINPQGNRGPIRISESVDFMDISPYLEQALTERLSIFGELPLRFVNFNGELIDEEAFNTPEFNRQYDLEPNNTSGLSDLQVGIKYGLWSDCKQILTGQFRTYVPTGDARLGLGTGHVSFEPGLLYSTRLNGQLSAMGQAKIWTPVNGGPNAGNVAIYGAGLGYDLYPMGRYCRKGCFDLRVTPLAEVVGWTILDGFESLSSHTSDPIVPNSAIVPRHDDLERYRDGAKLPLTPDPRPAPTSHGVQDVGGQTIVNAKFGVRTNLTPQKSIYIGYGRALTGPRWYQDVVRIELQWKF